MPPTSGSSAEQDDVNSEGKPGNDTMEDTATFVDSDGSDDDDIGDDDVDLSLYSILGLDKTTATFDDIHRSYKTLSTSFHPDKMIGSSLRQTTNTQSQQRQEEEQKQLFFLEIKRAHETLMDPVLRLVYDEHGEEGVLLLKKFREQQHDRKTRRNAETQKEQHQKEQQSGDDSDSDDDVEDGEDNSEDLYQQLLSLLEVQDVDEAKHVLHNFMKQHQYHQNLNDANHVHLSLNMDFPPVIDLRKTVKDGQQYMKYVQKSSAAGGLPTDADAQQRIKGYLMKEKSVVEYQFNRLKDGQKADIGFTLSSVPTNPSSAKFGSHERQLPPPKWSMAMGANTTLVYPHVRKLEKILGKQEDGQEQHHPASLFANAVHQPVANTQITFTTNLSNDNAHQLIVGTNRTFTNGSAFRYNMTFLATSPLPTNLIFNLKTYRHLLNVGMASAGFSVGGNGQVLQWSTKWEAMHRSKTSSPSSRSSQSSIISGVTQKVSVEAKIGLLQGNSVEFTYKAHLLDSKATTVPKSESTTSRQKQQSPEPLWTQFLQLADRYYMTLPRKFDCSFVFGQFMKASARFTHELKAMTATHLAFGLEHNISIGLWTWVWELTYHGSTFRVPVPVICLGTLSAESTQAYYLTKLYHAQSCLMLQSLVSDIIHDIQKTQLLSQKNREDRPRARRQQSKSKTEAEYQMKLMERVADMKRYNESIHDDGLVILRATYWVQGLEDVNTERIVLKEFDVTKQLQFWVGNHTLVAPSTPKRFWMGFYDLRHEVRGKSYTLDSDDKIHGENVYSLIREWWRLLVHKYCSNKRVEGSNWTEPSLTIRYRHKNEIYEATFAETEAFQLPCHNVAELLGNADQIE